MPTSNRLSMLVGIVMLLLFPLVFGPLFIQSLTKLHLNEQWAFRLMLAIIFGGLINIPVKRIVHERPVWSHPLMAYGLAEVMPRWLIKRNQTIIAVNVGGCLVPVGIALYQLSFLLPMGSAMIWAVTIAVAVNTIVCYFVATPVPNVGIVMPGFVAPLVAVIAALVLAPDQAPPVAFVAGVLGPLMGADLLHINAFFKTPVGVASIGGAGTFDGIVLSGLLAAFLA